LFLYLQDRSTLGKLCSATKPYGLHFKLRTASSLWMVRDLKLNSQVSRILDKLKEAGIPPLSSLSVVEARRLSVEMAKELSGPAINVASVRNFTVPLSEVEIPVRAYVNSTRSNLPALVYFHGGGWVLGDLDGVDWICR